MADRKDEWLGIVGDLISTPSENPPGDTTEIANYLTELLDDRSVPYRIIDPKETMPNVVAHFEGDAGTADKGRHLAFNGHLDTFPRRNEELWDRDPFSGEVADGKIHGRGASDMHGGFTASLAAFLYLFEQRDVIEGKVTLAAVSDEETGARWGTKYLVENYPEFNGDALISGEPSSNGIIRFAERGRAWLDVDVTGRSAHTCSVPRGLSAIDVLTNLLTDVRKFENDDRLVDVPPDVRETVLGAKEDMDAAYGDGATERILNVQVNVGLIDGGEKINLVAENANAAIDIRLPVGTTTDDIVTALESVAEEYPGDIEIGPASSVTNAFKDPTASDTKHPIFRHLQESAAAVRDGNAPSLSCALAGTDCAYYREAGVPCVVYGPSPHNLGSQNEFIYVDDFMEVVKAQAIAASRYMTRSDEEGSRDAK